MCLPYIQVLACRLSAIRRQGQADKLAYTAANRGGLGYIAAEYFQRLAGFAMQHVPYRGGGPAVADVSPAMCRQFSRR